MAEPQSIDEQFREESSRSNFDRRQQSKRRISRNDSGETFNRSERSREWSGSRGRTRGRIGRTTQMVAKRSGSGESGRGKIVERAMALAVFAPMIIPLGMAYLVQVLFGLLALVFMGLVALKEGSVLFNLLFSAIESVTISSTALMATCLLVTFIIGVASVVALAARGKTAGLAVLSGEEEVLKYICLCLIIPFYFFPFTNLFPWVFFYGLLVVWYPK